MKDIVTAVVDAIHMAGFVEIEVSAKHVHLTEQDVEVLFGRGLLLSRYVRCPSRDSSFPASA